MNELLRKRAIDIVDRLMSHPSAAPFLDLPVSTESDEIVDLSTIKRRLVENKYSKLQFWISDVEKCFSTIEKDDPENQKKLLLAAENRRIFDKEKRSIDVLSAHNWGNEVARLRGKIFDIMVDPPPKIKPFARSFIKANVIKTNTPTISEHELRCFVEASEKLTSDEDNNELYRIVSEFQPDLISNSDDMWFDVSKLNTQTYNALKNYIKAALEKNGEKYPE